MNFALNFPPHVLLALKIILAGLVSCMLLYTKEKLHEGFGRTKIQICIRDEKGYILRSKGIWRKVFFERNIFWQEKL